MLKRYFLLFSLITPFLAGNVNAQCVEIISEIEDVYCPGDELTLTATEGFENYSWYYNFSNSNQGGTLFETGGNTITLNASEWAVSYWYVEVDDAECTTPSSTVVWDSWVFAPIAISHESNTTFCPGDSSLVENAFNGPTAFQWFKDFEPIEGANSAQYWVTEPGYYTLEASYPTCPDYWMSSGLGPDFEHYQTTPPEISLETVEVTDVLNSSSGVAPQWYLNGEEIEGAIAQTYTPEVAGSYTVSIVDPNGCTVFSEPFQYGTVSTRENSGRDQIQVYPNPFQDQLMLKTPANHAGTIRLFDLTGKEMHSAILIPGTVNTIETIQLKPGIYMVETILDNGDRKIQKAVKY